MIHAKPRVILSKIASLENGKAIQITECLTKCVSDLASAAEDLKKCTTTSGVAAQNIVEAARPSPLEEHRKLFGFKPSTCTSSVYRGSSQAKRRKPSNGKVFIPIRNTWTHKFFLLADKRCFKVPPSKDKIEHGLAGLGDRDIVFQKDGNADHVNKQIFEAYPVLENCGGFEIMRTATGSCKILEVIAVPPGGYTVQFLKSCPIQAKGYVRPIQKSLPLKPLSLVKGNNGWPKEKRLSCGELIDINMLRIHSKFCSIDGHGHEVVEDSDHDDDENKK